MSTLSACCTCIYSIRLCHIAFEPETSRLSLFAALHEAGESLPGEGRIPQSCPAIATAEETLAPWRAAPMVGSIHGGQHLWWAASMVGSIHGGQHLWWAAPMAGSIHGGQHPWRAAPISAGAAPRQENDVAEADEEPERSAVGDEGVHSMGVCWWLPLWEGGEGEERALPGGTGPSPQQNKLPALKKAQQACLNAVTGTGCLTFRAVADTGRHDLLE